MKNNKYSQISLGVLALVIWGIIGFRIYRQLYPSNPQTTQAKSQIYGPTPSESIDQNGYELHLEYSDPFFRTLSSSKTSTQRHSAQQKRNSNKSEDPVKTSNNSEDDGAIEETIPEVIYKGYSINNTDITRVKVTIKGDNYTLRKGDTIHGLVLTEMHKTYLIFSFRGNEIIVNR